MKVEDLLQIQISLYRRVNENKSSMTISLDDFLHKLTPASKTTIEKLREVNRTDHKAAKAMKTMNLPCVTISGVFDGFRNIRSVTKTNPVMCIDIDEKADNITWDEMKEKVFNLPYVFYVSLSARGDGIYAMLYYNNENNFLMTFKAIEQEFSNMGITIDNACKDICRLRFVSYDEHPLEKTGEIQMYDKEYVKEFDDPFYENEKPVEFNKYDIYFLRQTIGYLIRNCGYRADSYSDWLVDGFRLASLGEEGYLPFMAISQNSDGWDERAAQKQWRECLKSTKMNKDSVLHYYSVAKERLGMDWKRIIRNS